MALSESEFDLALLQVQQAAQLYEKKSALVRLARKLYVWRKTCKNNLQLFFHRLGHKTPTKPANRLKLLVHVRGGIGDVCMTRLFVVRLHQKFPTALIDICYDHKDTVDMVFSDGYINQYVPSGYDPEAYDLVISGCHAFNFDYADKTRLMQLAPEWMYSFEKACALQQKLQIITQNTPHLDGLWAKISTAYGSSRVKNMGLTTGITVDQNDRAPIKLDPKKLEQTLSKWGLNHKPYVTIHDGTNTNTNLHGRAATRCWPRAHWEQFGRLFKQQFPHITLVQLGASNSTPFDFVDVCLVGKTQVADLPYVLEGALLHVDGESGMTQLANLTGTQAVVLFGPTPVEYFGYRRNINLQAENCRACMCIMPDWMSRCALFDTNQCMHHIAPEKVIEKIKTLLPPNPAKGQA